MIRIFLSRDFGSFVATKPEGGELWIYPENGLHPEKQVELGDKLIQLHGQGLDVNVQTHSEELILRMRLRVFQNPDLAKEIVVCLVADGGKQKSFFLADRRNFPSEFADFFDADLVEAIALSRAELHIPEGAKIILPPLEEETEEKGGKIETTHFQSWKVVAFLRGLGFSHRRDIENGVDIFTSQNPVECIFEGRGPSSRKNTACYKQAYRFVGSGGYDNVIVWESSSTNSAQLFTVIGLGSYRDWKLMVEDEPERFGLGHWLEYNLVSIE